MDIYCRICKEPWDNDCLHDEAEASDRTYEAVAADFRSKGCRALATAYGPQEGCEGAGDALISAVYDLMGDDMDGAMSALDDADYMGLL